MVLVIIFGAYRARFLPLSGFTSGQKGLRVNFFDVGQGDAALIRAPDGSDILIDGGPDGRIVEYLGRQLPPTDRTLELVVLTHPHADHLTGFLEVLRHYKVEKIMATGINYSSAVNREWLTQIKNKNIPVIDAKFSDVTSYGGAELRVLSPKEDLHKVKINHDSPGEGGGLNESSVVLLLDYGETEILFMGDAGALTEKEIMEKTDTKTDILKVGHHGSKYSTTSEFLEEINPRYAVISAGAGNKYGHPHYRTLRTLSLHGVRIFRTDLDGSIEAFSDGDEPIVYPSSEPPACVKKNFMLRFLSTRQVVKFDCVRPRQ